MKRLLLLLQAFGARGAIVIIRSNLIFYILAWINLVIACLATVYVFMFSATGFMDFSYVRTYLAPIISILDVIVNICLIKRLRKLSTWVNLTFILASVVLTLLILSPIVYALSY